MATYEEVIGQLAGELGIELAPDKNGTVMLQMKEGPEVRLEPTKEGDQLLIGMIIGDLEPGPGRATVLQAALIANGREWPRFGTFAYSRQLNQLVLSELVPFDGITGKRVKETLFLLVDQGRAWQEALKVGRLPIEPTVKHRDEPPLH